MAFDIGDFRSKIDQTGGTSQSNLFDAVIWLPTGLDTLLGGTQLTTTHLSLTCEGAEFPGVDIAPLEYRHHAFVRRIPYHYTFSPITLTFYCTGLHQEKSIFDAWVRACVDKQTGLVQYRLDSTGSPQYEGRIIINQYRQDGTYTYLAECDEVIPLSVTPINLNWGDDSIERLSVTFAYTRWFNYIEGGQPSGTPVPQNTLNILAGLGQEVAGLFGGVGGLVSGIKSGNLNQAIAGGSEAIAAGTDIFNQVSNFTNEI